jgi:hypothetical protein
VAVSFIGGGNRTTRRKPSICLKSLTNFITWCCSPSGYHYNLFKYNLFLPWYSWTIGSFSDKQQSLSHSLSSKIVLISRSVLNANFNNFSIISWRSVLLVVETGRPGENHRSVSSHWQTLSHDVVHLAMIEIRTHNISGDMHSLQR